METPAPLSPELFSRLGQLASSDPSAAADLLIQELSDGQDPKALFYAYLLKARVGYGANPYPTGSAHDLPVEVHEAYETQIREASRNVGSLLLEKREIAKAWPFFELIGEIEPVRKAIEQYHPAEDEDAYPVIDVAWRVGVHPEKGFDLLLGQQGICSTITMMSGTDLSQKPDLRDACLGKLVFALHKQLGERIRGDLEQRGRPAPEDVAWKTLLTDDLFAEESYHIDLSHLQSVVQMAMHLPNGPALDAVRDLCEYGKRLSPNLKRQASDPPFDESYDSYLTYFNIVAGIDVDSGIEYFHFKAAAGMAEGMTYPACVLVNLLIRIGRDQQALAVAKEFFAGFSPHELSCPGVVELARKVGDFDAAALAARQSGDAVTFLASTIAANR
ncbi:MAG: hypothetical protein U0798_21210 [Gemmataceae bacterium]